MSPLLFLSIHSDFASLSSDSEAAGRVRLPRASGSELPGHSSGGRPPRAAARLLRQHHQRARRQELPALAHAGGSHQNCSVYEGELMATSSSLCWRVFVKHAFVDLNGSVTPVDY